MTDPQILLAGIALIGIITVAAIIEHHVARYLISSDREDVE